MNLGWKGHFAFLDILMDHAQSLLLMEDAGQRKGQDYLVLQGRAPVMGQYAVHPWCSGQDTGMKLHAAERHPSDLANPTRVEEI